MASPRSLTVSSLMLEKVLMRQLLLYYAPRWSLLKMVVLGVVGKHSSDPQMALQVLQEAKWFVFPSLDFIAGILFEIIPA